MVADTDWRDASSYRYLDDLTPSELAWEFLRRNPEYGQEVAASDGANRRAATALTAHWGLRFPDRTKPIRPRRRNLLEPGSRPGGPHSRSSELSNHAYGPCHDRSRPSQSRG